LLSFRFNYKTGFVTGILSFVWLAGQFYSEPQLYAVSQIHIDDRFESIVFAVFFIYPQ
jgi:hypothetical protein